MNSRTWRGRVFIGVSADGKIAREDGTLDWLTDPSPRPHAVSGNSDRPALVWETFSPTIDTIVMGRATYESVLGFDGWPFDGKRVIVLTSRTAVEDARVTRAESVDEATRLLGEGGAAEVYIDGGRTIQSFLRAGLVDEITLSVAPIILGAGRSLFGTLDADVLLTVRGSHATEDGLVRTTYDVTTR
ncbi:dihydrofolate reductase family protein [Pseudoclavibacter terrae]|uniref:dihydrofolate reductase family protein n=1 Tax=Pseudoclavibacter terrae TaxID=1530195 RepID=UPI00232C74EF|nr:dihydrofolate reductase family protein [Pseudoclavibacter terrae]